MSATESASFKALNPQFYPNLMKLVNLKMSLPVSSAEAERSFSMMKTVKTPYRNALTDIRLSDLNVFCHTKET